MIRFMYTVDTSAGIFKFATKEDLQEWALELPGTDSCPQINSITDDKGQDYGLQWSVVLIPVDMI